MKYVLSFFLTLSVLCTSLTAVEYGYLLGGQTLELGQGDLFEAITVSPYNPNLYLTATNEGTRLLWIQFSAIIQYGPKPLVIGPATVGIFHSNANDSDGAVSYKLIRASAPKVVEASE